MQMQFDEYEKKLDELNELHKKNELRYDSMKKMVDQYEKEIEGYLRMIFIVKLTLSFSSSVELSSWSKNCADHTNNQAHRHC